MTTYYTTDQANSILTKWQCREPLPKKGYQVFVCFPGEVLNTCVVTVGEMKSTYGKKLYKFEFKRL